MSPPDHKEACRLFWIVKGHLNTSSETIESCYDSYFRRMWCNLQGESVEYNGTLDGFEEAYIEYLNRNDKR